LLWASPWTLYLAVTLPARHVQQNFYNVAWTGFDVALAAAIVATGIGVLWRRLWVQSAATCAATLLVCDAWFDVLSSNAGIDRLEAILMATFPELPTAAFCIYIAHHSETVAERAQRYALVARRGRNADTPERLETRSSRAPVVNSRRSTAGAGRALRDAPAVPTLDSGLWRHQPRVPGGPLNGPMISLVIQPP
jgi:hypothetical protein